MDRAPTREGVRDIKTDDQSLDAIRRKLGSNPASYRAEERERTIMGEDRSDTRRD